MYALIKTKHKKQWSIQNVLGSHVKMEKKIGRRREEKLSSNVTAYP